ncbi:hypothetical protein B9Z55_014154 [Caenorhabditis nigoni]|uniref:Uncharacterized protein n=1 Tax=Caenorhabditis nigoni TaxID=1611254 RepID=A0A2G5U4R4_9PELO|nr:hypothetical protein B9Z55_014154 [Caenorhabditis nigoni]
MSSYQVLVARVDCFSETPVSTYGKFLRQQVEGIMECFTSETVRKKNIDDMKEAEEAALEVKEKAIKKKKKASGTAKRLAEEIAAASRFSSLSAPFLRHDLLRERTASGGGREIDSILSTRPRPCFISNMNLLYKVSLVKKLDAQNYQQYRIVACPRT